jgi:hypothetical protein
MSYDNAPRKACPPKAYFERKEREAVKRERERLGIEALEKRIAELEAKLREPVPGWDGG